MMIEETEIKRMLEAHKRELERWISMDISGSVQLLNDVAHGKYDDVDDDALHENVDLAHDLIMAMLFTDAWNSESVPDAFFDTDMGRVILNVRLWLDSDELITIREAAQILRGATEDRDLIWVNAQIKNGKLERYTDLNEPNPQHAGRVSRQQVETLRTP